MCRTTHWAGRGCHTPCSGHRGAGGDLIGHNVFFKVRGGGGGGIKSGHV